MAFSQHTFLGNEIFIKAPKTTAEVLEYLYVILPKSVSEVTNYIFAATLWADQYCVDFDLRLDKNEPQKSLKELVFLCVAIVELSKTPPEIVEGLELYYSRTYQEPDDARTMKEMGPIFEGVPQIAIEVAAVTNAIREFGPQILQAPYWVYDALSLKWRHDLKRERAHRQKASDIAETKRIQSEVFG